MILYPHSFVRISTAQTFGARTLADGKGAWLYMTCFACDGAGAAFNWCECCECVFCLTCYGPHLRGPVPT